MCAITMTGEAASWPETARADDEASYKTSRVFDWEWLCRNSRPEMMIRGNGTEFTQDFQDALQSHGMKNQPIAVEIP